jgi:hypothetical protein
MTMTDPGGDLHSGAAERLSAAADDEAGRFSSVSRIALST